MVRVNDRPPDYDEAEVEQEARQQFEEEQADSSKQTKSEKPGDWVCEDFFDLRAGEYPNRGTEIIQGVLRDGEVALLVAASKDGKSWMAGQLAWCVITGTPFLGLDVRKGKVLLIDNELKRREIDWRHTRIAEAMQVQPQPGQLQVAVRRGKCCDINYFAGELRSMDLDGYSLIIIDALYKIIPEGKAENDNPAMGQLMNILQNIADKTNVPILIVHHTTKGDQSAKATLDLAAGAGAFGRSLDAMIAIRDHETDGHSVCEFKSRTNKSAASLSIQFEWPLWQATSLAPNVRKARGGRDEKSKQDDAEADKLLLESLTKRPQSESQLVRSTGMGPTRISRAIGRAIAAENIESKNVVLRGI